MASFKNLVSTTSAQISSGGTITGDLVINGDLQVDGGGSLSFDEIVQGTQVVEITNTEALLVRKASDGGDVFIVDTSNMDVTVNGAKNTTTFSVTNNWSTTNDYIRIALNDATIRSTVLDSGARNLILAPLGNDALTLHSTSGGVITANIGGALGVGTSSPTNQGSALHIYQNHASNNTFLTVESDGANASAYIDIDTAADRDGFIRFKEAGTDKASIFNDASADSLVLTDGANSNTVFIKSDSVGIGATPLSALMIQTTNALDVTTAPTGSISFGSPSSTLQGAISGRQTSNTTALHLMGSGADGNTSGDMIFNVRENDNSTFATLTNSAFKFQHFSTDLVTILRNGSVGIGVSTMESTGGGVSQLQVEGTTHETSSVSITRNANSANAGYLTFSKSRGTSVNSDTIVQDDDAIGSILFAPADGTDRNSISASIQGAIDGTPGSNDVPGRLVFSTTADGANSVTERMRITSAGNVGIGSSPASYTDAISTSQTLSVGENQDSSDKLASIQIIGRGVDSTDDLGALEFINTRSSSGVVASIVGGRYNGGSVADGSLSFKTKNGSSFTTKMTINDVGNVGIGTDSPSTNLHLYSAEDYNPTLTIENAHAGSRSPFLSFKKTSSSPANNDKIGQIQFNGNDATGSSRLMAFIEGYTPDVTGGAYDGAFRFSQMINASQTEVMTITGGNVGIGTTSPSEALEINKAGANLKVVSDNNVYLSLDSTQTNGDEWQIFNANSGATSTLQFKNIDQSKLVMLMEESGLIGIGTASPSDYDAGGNNLVIYENGNSGITIASATTGIGAIHFADGTTGAEAYQGIVRYSHSDHNLQFGVAGTNYRFKLDNNSRISLSNNDSGGTGGRDGTTGNTIFGYNAGNVNSGAVNNTFIGHVSGSGSIDEGDNNTAVGCETLQALTTASGNQAIGSYSGFSITTGGNNVLIGNDTGFAMTGTTDTVLIGHQSGTAINNTGANGSVAVGSQSLKALTSGAGNIAVGYTALNSCTSGGSNVAIGDTALRDIVTGGANVAIGRNAGQALGAGENGNILIGMASGQALDEGTSGLIDSNIAIGKDCFTGGNLNTASTSVLGNIAIGTDALNSTGTNAQTGTIAIGHNALTALTSGASNTAVGYQSMDATDNGSYNTAVGYTSLSANCGDSNTCIGYASGLLITGSMNTTIGTDAGNGITSGTNNVVIGKGSDTDDATATNQTVVGYATTGVADNSVTLGNADVTDVYMAQDSGATVHADYVLSQGNQDNTANTMSSPYYRFDGVDDKIDCGNNFDFSSGDFAISAWVYADLNHVSGHGIVGIRTSGSANTEVQLYIDTDNKIKSWNGSNNVASTATISDQKWTHIVMVQSGGNKLFYINGVLDSTHSQSNGSSLTETLKIGYTGYSAEYLKGSLSCVQLYNLALTATEVKELYSGASVPYKYKGANQTEIITNGDFSSTVSSAYGGWSYDSGNNEVDFDSSTGTAESQLGIVASDWTNGKRYRITFTVANVSSGALKIKFTTSTDVVAYADYTNGTHSVEFTAPTTASNDITVSAKNASGGGASGSLTNISAVPIGAVAEYDGSGVTNTKWYDKSGNELHGTVSGATDENTAGAPVVSENYPAFLVQPNAEQNNLAVDTNVDIVFDVERFDQGSNFASNTFTAPVTGKYFLNFSLYGKAVDSASPYIQVYIVTSNRTYTMIIDPDVFGQDATYWSFSNSALADMDVNDTAKIQVFQSSGTAQLDIGNSSYFSGHLVC